MVHVPITPVEAIAAIGTFLGISWLIPTVMCVRGLCCPLDGDGGPGGGAALPPPSLSRGSEQIARRGIPHATAPLLAQQPAAVPPPPVKNWRLTLALLILAATIENSLTLTTFSVESLAAHLVLARMCSPTRVASGASSCSVGAAPQIAVKSRGKTKSCERRCTRPGKCPRPPTGSTQSALSHST